MIAACRSKIDEDRYQDFCKQLDNKVERPVLRSFLEFLAGLKLENQESCFEAIVCILGSQENDFDYILQRLQKGNLNLLLFSM